MGQPGIHDGIAVAAGVEPLKERRHLSIDARRRKSLKMYALLPGRSGDHPHRAAAVITPGACPDLRHAAASYRKQGRLPRKESIGGERLLVVTGGVKHHFDDALHMAI
jgi:hypothetical protein